MAPLQGVDYYLELLDKQLEMLLLCISEKISHWALRRQERGGHGGPGQRAGGKVAVHRGRRWGYTPQAQLEIADQMLQSNRSCKHNIACKIHKTEGNGELNASKSQRSPRVLMKTLKLLIGGHTADG